MAQIILDSNNNLIQGDFDNATLNNRTKLQTTTTNATTNVYVVPNGSSTSAGVSVANNSSLTNASKIVMATNGSTDTQIISGVNGSGTYLPLSFYTNNALAAQITTAGDLSVTGVILNSSGTTALLANGASASIVTSTANLSFYQVFANCVGNTTVFASALIYFNGAGTATVQSIMGTGMSISSSGANIITVTNSAGSSQQISWTVIRYK